MKKQSFQIVLYFLAVLLVVGFPADVLAGDTIANKTLKTIRIVHTNDTHGRYKASDSEVGFERLKTIANDQKADLILDAGDTFHGQSFATVEKGGSTAELLKAVGYQAMTPGNHDFNYGKARLKELEEISNVSVLSCNIIDDSTGKPYFTPSKTIEIQEGIKVGIIGITSPDIYDDTAPSNVEGLTFADPSSYVQQEIDQLKKNGCTIIIGLAHIGDSSALKWTSDRLVSETIGLDILIDGHTHDVENKVVDWKDKSGKTLCVQTGAYFQNVGTLDIQYDVDTKKVVNLSTDNFTLISASEAEKYIADQDVSQTISSIETRINGVLKQEVGESPQDVEYTWEKVRCAQMLLGNVIGDAYLAETGADVACENAGGIRGGIQKGVITQGDIIDIAPFGNYVVTKKVSGETILRMLEASLEIGIANQNANDAGEGTAWPENSGSFLQWGGINVVWNPAQKEGSRVVKATIGGKELEPGKAYILATNNFVAVSQDYPQLAAAEEIHQYSACDEILTKYLSNQYASVPDWTVSLNKQYFKVYQEEGEQDRNENVSAKEPEKTESGSQGKSVSSDKTSENEVNAAQTGDDFPVAFAGAIAAVAFMILLLLFLQKQRQRNKKNER